MNDFVATRNNMYKTESNNAHDKLTGARMTLKSMVSMLKSYLRAISTGVHREMLMKLNVNHY